MRWIVCFTNVKQVGFWRFYSPLRSKFTHCYLVKYDQLNETWNLFEFHTGGFRFSSKKGEKADPMIQKMLTNAVCIEFTPKRQRHWLPSFSFPWLYCVSFCKHAVGITKWTVLTPDQLHCELLKQGGQEIFVWNEEIADGIA